MSEKLYCSKESYNNRTRKIISDLYELALIYSIKFNRLFITENSKYDKVSLIERVPMAIEKLYGRSEKILEFNKDDIKDLRYIVNHKYYFKNDVNMNKEIEVKNIYDELKRLEASDKIKLYYYPNRPNYIPKDDSDLINNSVNNVLKDKNKLKKLREILLVHPELLYSVNNYIINNDLGYTFSEDDLIIEYEKYLKYYSLDKINNTDLKIADDLLELIYFQYCNYYSYNPSKLNLIDIDYKQSILDDKSRKRLLFRLNHKERERKNEI